MMLKTTMLKELFTSQALFPQLLRVLLLLIAVIIGANQYQPLMDAMAKHAVNSGCHQSNGDDSEHTHHHQHHHHHQGHR